MTASNHDTPGRARPRITLGWLTAAASLAAAIGAGIYAWSLRSQLDHLQQSMTELSERANTLRNNLDDARREAARLSRAVDIMQGPGTIQVDLRGMKDAPAALGRAYINATRGMIVNTEKLPALRPGRAYQLWMVVPGKAPISAGVFGVVNGAGVFVSTMPDLSAASGSAVTVAVTEEPAGGSPGPTTPILLAGEMKTR